MKQWITHNEKSASKHTVGGLEKKPDKHWLPNRENWKIL